MFGANTYILINTLESLRELLAREAHCQVIVEPWNVGDAETCTHKHTQARLA